MNQLSLGFVSDEISPDFREAARHAKGWGVSLFELRVLKSGRVPAIDAAELKDVFTVVENEHLRITALSPGIFKHPLSKSSELKRELEETLPQTLDLAKKFNASLVIVFGFQREANEAAGNFARVVDFMNQAAEEAEQVGITLAIENEPGFWCDSGSNTARLIQAVDSPALRANWDPCNGYGTPETPFPDGYEAIKRFIANVHVKDTKKGALIECVPVGEGVIDWKGQLQALLRDQIVKHVTIETHCLPLVEKSKQNVEALRKYLEELGVAQEASL